jgi:hypothetical protein
LLVVPIACVAALGMAVGCWASDGSVGPGADHTLVAKRGYRIAVWIDPNLGGRIASTFTLQCTRADAPVTAHVTATFTMPNMLMPLLRLQLRPRGMGRYNATGVMLIMPGRWQIDFRITPAHAAPFDVVLADHALFDTPG